MQGDKNRAGVKSKCLVDFRRVTSLFQVIVLPPGCHLTPPPPKKKGTFILKGISFHFFDAFLDYWHLENADILSFLVCEGGGGLPKVFLTCPSVLIPVRKIWIHHNLFDPET